MVAVPLPYVPKQFHHLNDETHRSSQQSNSPIPPTYLEQKRAEAQALYREEKAYIAANKANFERLLEEDRQAMAKEMSGNAVGVVQSMLFGKKPEPPEPATADGANATTPEKKA